MNKTPSYYRQKGREAFNKNTLPENVCPYRGNSDSPMFKKYYWFRGWEEAEKEFLKEQKLKKKCIFTKMIRFYGESCYMEVDGVTMWIDSESIEYFKEHYKNLGYTVIEIN